MVENEQEYIDFLIQSRNITPESASSYASYLKSVSKHLEIEINFSNITSEKDVKSIIKDLKKTKLAGKTQSNYGTALRAYLRFVEKNRETAYTSPDEIVNPNQYAEGVKKTITVNKYERNNKARKKCIEIHGLNCTICKMNFEETYGSIGADFIHVHHITPLSEVNEHYKVNPETELIPVCPNCHAMLHHRKETTMSIESLRKIYKKKTI